MEPSFLDNGYRSPSIRRTGIVEVDVRGMASLPDLDSYPLLFHLSEIKERHYLERKDNAERNHYRNECRSSDQTGEHAAFDPTPDPQEHSSATFGRITQWVAVVLSVIALLLGIVANLHVSMIQGGISRSASELASALSSDGTSASSGSDTKAMKKTGKKTEVKTVEYTAAEGSVLEGDYVLDGYCNRHLKLVKLEVTGTKATLTSELTNNGTESDSWSFSATAFQNGQQTGIGVISTDGQIQAGYTATATTEFDIKDATQPISLEVNMGENKLQIEYSPQN